MHWAAVTRARFITLSMSAGLSVSDVKPFIDNQFREVILPAFDEGRSRSDVLGWLMAKWEKQRGG
jgi:hypothetical protein